MDALLDRLDRWFDDEYTREPDTFVNGLALSIDQLLNASLQYDDPAIDAARTELRSIRSQIPMETDQRSLARDEYDRLNTRFSNVIEKDVRLYYCSSEMSEVKYMHIVLLRLNELETIAKDRHLTETEINELDSLPGELEKSQRKLAELREGRGLLSKAQSAGRK